MRLHGDRERRPLDRPNQSVDAAIHGSMSYQLPTINQWVPPIIRADLAAVTTSARTGLDSGTGPAGLTPDTAKALHWLTWPG